MCGVYFLFLVKIGFNKSYDTNFVLLKLKFITRTSYKIRVHHTRTHTHSQNALHFFFI